MRTLGLKQRANLAAAARLALSAAASVAASVMARLAALVHLLLVASALPAALAGVRAALVWWLASPPTLARQQRSPPRALTPRKQVEACGAATGAPVTCCCPYAGAKVAKAYTAKVYTDPSPPRYTDNTNVRLVARQHVSCAESF